MKKYVSRIIIIMLCILLFINYICFADDNIEQNSLEEVDELLQTAVDTSNEPVINSRAAVIFERTTGRILWGKNENEQRKMASTTKIMTALIVLENSNLQDTVLVSGKAARYRWF